MIEVSIHSNSGAEVLADRGEVTGVFWVSAWDDEHRQKATIFMSRAQCKKVVADLHRLLHCGPRGDGNVLPVRDDVPGAVPSGPSVADSVGDRGPVPAGQVVAHEYPKPAWATGQFLRASGLVEDKCCHGIGHPNRAWLQANDPDDRRCLSIHGCDGCCSGTGPKTGETT